MISKPTIRPSQKEGKTRFVFPTTIALAVLYLAGCNQSIQGEVGQSTFTSAVNETSTFHSHDSEHAEPDSPLASNSRPETGESIIIDGALDTVDWRSLIGKNITVTGELVIVDTFDLIRRGQVKVARERLYVPTSQIDPNDKDANANSFEGGNNVANVTRAQKFNDKATIILDDGSAQQNIFPPTLFPKLGRSLPTVRIGSRIQGVSGKLVKAGNNLLLVVNKPLRWEPAERPTRPDVGKADITVSSFNVLNYFTTIDNGKNNARGADSESEFDRQEAKLVSAIQALDADIIGLMEIENNVAAEQKLINALNRKAGKEVYQGCGLPDNFRNTPGGRDSIRVGIIYRSDRVRPLGQVTTVNNEAFFVARAPVVQSFRSHQGGEPLTVIVNHFKSKGGADRADVANKNKGDGQGAYNAARRGQSLAICRHVQRLTQNKKNSRVLVIGDLNAYQQEDPIDAMRAMGLVDLHEQMAKNKKSDTLHYSYIYYGQCGSLDHAMATQALADDLTGIATWHINADEPRFLDYNEEHNPKALFQADPFRSSDHDPVIIGIRN